MRPFDSADSVLGFDDSTMTLRAKCSELSRVSRVDALRKAKSSQQRHAVAKRWGRLPRDVQMPMWTRQNGLIRWHALRRSEAACVSRAALLMLREKIVEQRNLGRPWQQSCNGVFVRTDVTTAEMEMTKMEQEIDMARAKLGDDLEAVTETGRRAIQQVMHQSRPFVIGLAVATGIALVASVVRLVRVSTSPTHRLRHHMGSDPSMSGQVLRSALTSIAGTLATVVAKRLMNSIASAEQPKPFTRLAAPPPPPPRRAIQQ
jgi:sensor c-di-GMP phosphodiesterase-like protein